MKGHVITAFISGLLIFSANSMASTPAATQNLLPQPNIQQPIAGTQLAACVKVCGRWPFHFYVRCRYPCYDWDRFRFYGPQRRGAPLGVAKGFVCSLMKFKATSYSRHAAKRQVIKQCQQRFGPSGQPCRWHNVRCGIVLNGRF